MIPNDITTRRIGAEAHDVTYLELGPLDARVVYVRAVGRLQILEHDLLAAEGDASVAAGDGRV